MKDLLTVGQRVKTKFGMATVVGFEHFNPDGRTSYLVTEDVQYSNSRVRCKLDEPWNWSLSSTGGDPYFMRSDLSEPEKEV